MTSTHIDLSLEDAHAMARDCLLANGCDAANADAVAANMLAAERDGCVSHGLFRLPGYVTSLRSKKFDGHAAPTIERLAPGVIRVDARSGAAPLAVTRTQDALAPLARTQGIAAAAIVDVYHMAALWPDVEPLAEQGLAALALTASASFVAAAGGKKPFFGTNPMAFAWPRDGHALPEGVGLDSEGRPTTDPQAVLDDGVLLPFGGYKGSSIALMVDLLAAGLIGQPFSPEIRRAANFDGGPESGGMLIIAMDPDRFGDAAGWRQHAEGFFGEMLADGGVRLPGQRRFANRARAEREGIMLPAALHAKIVELSGHS